MRKPPFNRPAFSSSSNSVFGKVFGPESESEPAFSPLDLPDLKAWYDASDLTTITISFGQVDAWADKSGNGNAVTASGTDRPSTGININGLNTIEFDGIDEFLEASSFAPTPDLTIAFVFQAIAVDSNNDAIISFQDNTAGNDDFQLDANNATEFLCNFNSTGLSVGSGIVESPTDLIGADQALISRLEVSNNSVILFNSSGSIASDVGNYNGALGSDQSFKIGANRGAGQFLECNIGEIVVVNRDISSFERAELFTYFFNKWGTVALPTLLTNKEHC